MTNYGMEYSGLLIHRIRARYEGTDGIGPEHGERLVVSAIADDFGVHPNSIFAWSKRFTWRRPAWYVQKRPFRKKRHGQGPGGLRQALHEALKAIAAEGVPCPTNVELALKLGGSVRGIVVALQQLGAEGIVSSETNGPARRLSLEADDGSLLTTGWTVLPPMGHDGGQRPARPARPSLVMAAEGPSASERRSQRNARLLERLCRAADDGEAFPSDAELGRLCGVNQRSVWDLLKRLEAAGHFRLERRPNKRSAVLKDGRRVPWSFTPPPVRRRRKGIDLAACEAVRALQRMGKVTFDVAVVTGRGWGIAWSIDGKILCRDEMIAYARERCTAAVEQLRAAA